MNTLTKSGKIRANKTCPYLTRCSNRTKNCPQRGNVKATQHDCGVARLFAQASKRIEAQPLVQIERAPEPFRLSVLVEEKFAERRAGSTWVNFSITERLQGKLI